MNRIYWLKVILFTLLGMYTVMMALGSYTSIVTKNIPPDITPVAHNIQVNSETSIVTPLESSVKLNHSSNVLMVWHVGDGKTLKHHSFTTKEFDKLTEVAKNMTREELDEYLEKGKLMETKEFVAVINKTPTTRTLAKLQSGQ
jgi:hypothetical protein